MAPPWPGANGYASTPVIQVAGGTPFAAAPPPLTGRLYTSPGGGSLSTAALGGIGTPATMAAAPSSARQAGNASSISIPAGAALTGDARTAATPTAPRPVGTERTALGTATATTAAVSARERALEQRVRELEALLQQKDRLIEELRAGAAKPGGAKAAPGGQPGAAPGHRRGYEMKPDVRYAAVDQNDPIDVRLEEFYNSTGSVIQFKRINRGFYRFGETICEVDIINHKLMARTEDGWNHCKFGPIEKFLVYYENIERQKAGITPEA